jgi:sucrose phosphorylase
VSNLAQHLAALYGDAVARAAGPRLQQRLAQCRPRRASSAHSRDVLPLSERDALLITYADQVSDPGGVPLRTLAEFASTHLRGVFNAVHLLPFYPWSSDDGFSVKDYFAVAPEYGTWSDLRQLGQEFDLMFDGVFNHLSAQSDWFRRFLRDEPPFQDFFICAEPGWDLSRVVRPRVLPLLTQFKAAGGPRQIWTTFSADQVDLNFRNPEVLLAVLDALLFYVEQGARFIRLDAIAFLWKEPGTTCVHLPETHRVIQLMRAVLDEIAPDVLLITETNVPHRDNLSYFGDGTNEAQLIYNFALPPLVLHSMQTGNASALSRWADSLALPSDGVTFLNFLASHDGIGLNPARGILTETEIDQLVQRTLDRGGFISCKAMPDGSEIPYEMNINYLDALSDPSAGEPASLAARKTLTAHAILLSLAGVPAVYFHSFIGSRGDRAGAETSGIKRRINREKLERVKLESELKAEHSLRAHVFEGMCEQLRLRRAHPAFAPAASQKILSLDPRVFAVQRGSADGADQMLCLHNVSAENVRVAMPGMPEAAQLEAYTTQWLPHNM